MGNTVLRKTVCLVIQGSQNPLAPKLEVGDPLSLGYYSLHHRI